MLENFDIDVKVLLLVDTTFLLNADAELVFSSPSDIGMPPVNAMILSK